MGSVLVVVPLVLAQRVPEVGLVPNQHAVQQFGAECLDPAFGAERFLTLLRAVPIPAHRLHTVSPAESAAALARRRSHVGVLPRVTVAPDLAAGTLVELPVRDLPDWSLTLALAYRAAEASSPPVHALRDHLLA